MIVQAVKWIGGVDGFLELVDQRRLPGKFVKLQCRSVEQLYRAINALAIRGAPAIGVAAAYGLVLAMQKLAASDSLKQGLAVLNRSCKYLASSRPTAVNLFWAWSESGEASKHSQWLNQRRPYNNCVRLFILRRTLSTKKTWICAGGLAKTARGLSATPDGGFIKNGFGILTHCNAGALATAGQGTALSVLFEAHKKGKKFKVYVDETTANAARRSADRLGAKTGRH